MPGRRPKPTALSLIDGNPGKRPLPKNEPRPAAAKPNAPAHLSAEAKKHWRTIIKQLHAAKIMTRLDADALAIYCEAYTRWIDANEKVRTDGMVITSPNGVPVLNPHLSICNKAFDQMRSMLIEFGMTPAARTKVQAIKEEKDEIDPWSKV